MSRLKPLNRLLVTGGGVAPAALRVVLGSDVRRGCGVEDGDGPMGCVYASMEQGVSLVTVDMLRYGHPRGAYAFLDSRW
jgi:hypothetical protein